MCGRFVHHASTQALQELALTVGAELSPAHLLPPRYNLAPTQTCLGLVRGPAAPLRHSALLRFGMARHPSGLVLNARAETVAERPMFRSLLKWHRCLVVASGFYEWQPPQAPGGRKTPYLFTREDGAPFCFAALRARSPRQGTHGPEKSTKSRGADASGVSAGPPAEAEGGQGAQRPGAVLITCAANAVVSPLHARMPVMLTPQQARLWLDWETDIATSLALLQPYAGAMRAHAVGQQVNRPQHDAPDCLLPAQSGA